MATLVLKFGGSSVATPDRLQRIADRIVAERRAGNDLVVVVSAMGDTTDDLLTLARAVCPDPFRRHPRELDMLLSAGERISMALLAMSIRERGEEAVSFTGSQAAIITDTMHTGARILEIRADRVREALSRGRIAIVAGFQGVSQEREVTTLGRGGSDTTAVAVCHALDGEACELYTDVPGVFTADPRLVPQARRMASVSFEELLEMTATGCPKPAMRSVEYARRWGVKLHVRSAFTWEPGTWVVEEDPTMEQAIVSAVTHDTSEAKVTVSGVPDRPGIAGRLFRELAEVGVNVDMIVQNVSDRGVTDISFTVPRSDLTLATEVCQRLATEIGATGVSTDSAIARVSIIGAGMKSNPGVAAKMFEVLAREGINIEMISTSAIRISCVVREAEVERAVQSLHTAFELDAVA